MECPQVNKLNSEWGLSFLVSLSLFLQMMKTQASYLASYLGGEGRPPLENPSHGLARPLLAVRALHLPRVLRHHPRVDLTTHRRESQRILE